MAAPPLRLAEEALRKRKAIETSREIRYKFVVVSGKGGVGKSLVSANLALAFSMIGLEGKVGLLDADVHGGTLPLYLGMRGASLRVEGGKIIPPVGPEGVKVFSVSFLLDREDTPVIWRGPLKAKFIEQALADVDWSGTEVLIVDTPPGTGDELMATLRSLNRASGAILVTTPSQLSLYELRKVVLFLREMGVKPLGVVENMSYVMCGEEEVRLFGPPIDDFASSFGLRVLGRIPMYPELCEPSGGGLPYLLRSPDSKVAREFVRMARDLLAIVEESSQ